MKILVIGGSGFVGWAVLSADTVGIDLTYTYNTTPLTHPHATGVQLDIRDSAATRELLCTINPDGIIHAAAMTDVDYCENHPDEAYETNVRGTEHVLDAAAQIKSHVVYISTAAVFDGSDNPYGAAADRSPISVYGRTKATAERRVEQASVLSAIVRTDQPYGWSLPPHSPTMVEWTLDQLASQETVNVFDDWHNMPTFVDDLADALIEIALNRSVGVFHLVGPDYVSRYEWARKIATAFGHDASNISPCSAADAGLPARRSNVRLKRFSVEALSTPPLCFVEEGLKKMCQE